MIRPLYEGIMVVYSCSEFLKKSQILVVSQVAGVFVCNIGWGKKAGESKKK